MILAPMRQVGWRRACSRRDRGELAGVASRNGPPDAVRISRSIAARGSPTRHCQIAECSESIGRSQASGSRAGRTGRPPRARAARRARQRHDEVAARDERLLVGGRDHLAGAQRGEHRAGARRRPPVPTTTRSTSSRVASASRASAPPTRCVPGGRSSGAAVVGEADHGGPEPARLLGEVGGVAARSRARPRGTGRRAAEDVDRLAADRPRRAEQGDPTAARRRRSAREGEDIEGDDAARRTGTSRSGRGCRRGPG